jgi:molybdopterin molybdotransferase
VLVLSTGSELIEQGRPVRPGEIYDSNGPMLAAAVTQAGGEPTLLRFVPDDTDAFHAALRPHLDSVDLVLTSGGVSAGAYEVVKEALTGTGVEFFRVAMQPGMPQGAGMYRIGELSVPMVALPGNPVSASVSFEIFVRPALLAAAGHRHVDRPRLRARLTEALRSPAGRRQFRRAHYESDPPSVTPVGGTGSHLLAALAAADYLLEIPEETTELSAGTEVTVLRTRH